MSRPTVLFPNSGTPWLVTNFQWRSAPLHDTTTHFAYAMWHVQNGAFFDMTAPNYNSLIKVEKSTNTWQDGHATGSPETVDDSNGSTVTITYQGSTYVFGKPTQWWTNTPPPASNSQPLVPTATIVGGTFEQRGYPIGDYGLTSHLPGNGVYNHQTFWTVSTETDDIQHTISNLADGSYWLSNNVVGLNSPEVIVAGGTRRKVHSNFW